MVKAVFLLRRLPHLTREEFLRYWHNQHAALAREAAAALRIRRYVQVHPLTHPSSELIRQSRGCLAPDLDGIAEAWWDSFDDMLAVGHTQAEIGARVLAERSFVDLERSQMWFGQEHEIIGSH